MALDAETAARWAGVAVGGIAAALGITKWWSRRQQKKKEEMDARFKAKADLLEIEHIHARIARHKKANEEHTAGLKDYLVRHERMIKENYDKHDMVQEQLLEAEKRSSDRFEKVLAAIAGLNRA